MAKKISEADLNKIWDFGTNVWNEFITPLAAEMKEIEKYIHLNDLDRGKILNCALVLEYMVDRYLAERKLAKEKELNPLKGLKFAEKLDRMEKCAEPSFSRGLIDGMRAINVIRNNYAHRLDFKVEADHLSHIEHMNDKDAFPPFDPTKEDYAVRTIENYTLIASAYIHTQTGQVKSGVDGLYKKHPNLKAYFDGLSDSDLFARNQPE